MFNSSSFEFQLAISSVVKAGKIVREIYNSSFKIQWKSKDDPLTEADLFANKEILSQIQTAFPDDGILSEESTDNSERLSKDRVWILDPIDGTREFVNKNPEFSISLGLSVKGKPVIGVVYNPITGELVSGIVGSGVSLNIILENEGINFDLINLKPLEFKNQISQPLTYVSRSEFEKDKLFDKNPFWKENFNLTPIGSIAYKLALTACGKGDLSISLKPKNEWDICAGVALILASGGTVVDLANQREVPFNSKFPLQKGILAGNPNLVKNLISNKSEFLRNSLVDWN